MILMITNDLYTWPSIALTADSGFPFFFSPKATLSSGSALSSGFSSPLTLLVVESYSFPLPHPKSFE